MKKPFQTGIRAVLAVICIGAVLAAIYGYGILQGWFLLNNPSRKLYPIRGVDVSHYQGEIDWAVLSGQDIRFAYIKATEGSSHTDGRFLENWDHATVTDLKVGAYHFFSFDSPAETQAEHFIKTVQGFDGMLPPVVDFEFYGDKKASPPPVEPTVHELWVMLGKLRQHYGMTPILYATEETYHMYLEGRFDEYPLWIRNVTGQPDTDTDWLFWQYSNRGRLDGYTGDERFIDLNVFAGDEVQWAEFTETGGQTDEAQGQDGLKRQDGAEGQDGLEDQDRPGK